jgi:predicted secreted protein
MILVIYSPCILSPYLSYKGYEDEIDENNIKLYNKFVEIMYKYKDKVIFRSYLCPETLLTLSIPRLPASREIYERIGMKEISNIISSWIDNLIRELNPEKIIFIGRKYSPTCGVNGTYRIKENENIDKIFEYWIERKIDKKEMKEKMYKKDGEPGILIEELMKKFNNIIFIDIDNKNIEESLNKLEELLK